jgi:hypothetical protein
VHSSLFVVDEIYPIGQSTLLNVSESGQYLPIGQAVYVNTEHVLPVVHYNTVIVTVPLESEM